MILNDISGLQLFSTKSNRGLDEISGLEEKYSFFLPKDFKFFLRNFELISTPKIYSKNKENIGIISNDIVVKEILNEEDYLAMNRESLNFESFGGIGLRELFEIDFIFESYQSSDLLEDEEFLMFASWGGGDNSLLVGYGEHNYDQIYIDNDWFSDTPFRKLTNSIIDLIPLFRQHLISNILVPEKLYKNWGEDFWRIKEDNNPTT